MENRYLQTPPGRVLRRKADEEKRKEEERRAEAERLGVGVSGEPPSGGRVTGRGGAGVDTCIVYRVYAKIDCATKVQIGRLLGQPRANWLRLNSLLMSLMHAMMNPMLTRLEVDGFKNLKDFAIDFGPYTCIVGRNAVGKSNIFDAVAFLGATAGAPLNEAAANLRGLRGDISEIFGGDGRTIKLAAEMIVHPSFKDDFGQEIQVDNTFLRYELEIALREKDFAPGQTVRTIELVRESLKTQTKKQSQETLPWAKKRFRDSAIRSNGSPKRFIETHKDYVEARSNQSGRPPRIPLKEVGSTILSVYGRSSEYSIISAARRELSSWKLLALEPSAMRSPSAMTGPSVVDERGDYLPATLARLKAEYGSNAETQLEDIMLDLVDVRGVSIDMDSSRQLITLQAQIGDSPWLPARALSDGTLRFIALGLLALDPQSQATLCFEEPENGIYPDKLSAMKKLLHDLAVDPQSEVSQSNPLRQMIVNSHSPAYLKLHQGSLGELLIAKKHPLDGSVSLLPVAGDGNWRTETMTTPSFLPDNIEELLNDVLGTTTQAA